MSEPIEVRQTPEFRDWFDDLRDDRARGRIDARLRRVARGAVGDAKSVGGGVSELRIDYGPGYRLYYTRREQRLILLLVGGDKSSQARDIMRARAMAQMEAD